MLLVYLLSLSGVIKPASSEYFEFELLYILVLVILAAIGVMIGIELGNRDVVRVILKTFIVLATLMFIIGGNAVLVIGTVVTAVVCAYKTLKYVSWIK